MEARQPSVAMAEQSKISKNHYLPNCLAANSQQKSSSKASAQIPAPSYLPN